VTEIPVRDRDPGADPAFAVDRRHLVEEALGALQPMPRAALVLRHYYGYDYEQIGAFLGTSSGNVGSMLSRAHATLRTRLSATDAAADAPATVVAPRRAAR
jgi:DNA-directed RNA polymerase specialized sigma24 family protein